MEQIDIKRNLNAKLLINKALFYDVFQKHLIALTKIIRSCTYRVFILFYFISAYVNNSMNTYVRIKHRDC